MEQDANNAGDFAAWLSSITAAIDDGASSDVPCGSCTACCTSAQFVHIDADETATLKRIPKKLLFAAPGSPTGSMVMGYDKNGHCPMFNNGGCSIYAHRPRTCRVYDCRVYSAAGIEPDADKTLIAAKTQRWAFHYADDEDRCQHAAIQAAAAHLTVHPELFTTKRLPKNPGQLAAIAIAVHSFFVATNQPGRATTHEVTNEDALRQAIHRYSLQ